MCLHSDKLPEIQWTDLYRAAGERVLHPQKASHSHSRCRPVVVSGRDLGELGGHSPGALEAAVAGERHPALPHPPSGRQHDPAGAHRRPRQRFREGGAAHPAHLCHGKTVSSPKKEVFH